MWLDMNLRRAIVLLAFAIGAAPWTHAAEPAPLKVRLLADVFPPLQYVDPSGAPRGGAYRLVSDALAEVALGMALEVSPIEFVPLRRALQTAALQPNVLVLSVARTPEREPQFHWLATVSPYELWLYRHKGRPLPTVKDFAQLRGKGYRFGVQNGGNFHEWLRRQGVGEHGDHSSIDPVPQNGQNFGKAQLGRIDFFAHPEISFAYRAAEHGLHASDFEKVLLIDELSTPLWVIASPGSDARLLTALTQHLHKMWQSGQADHIRREALREFNEANHLDAK